MYIIKLLIEQLIFIMEVYSNFFSTEKNYQFLSFDHLFDLGLTEK